MTVTAQSKSLLAKLLATENITIRRNANAKTASFDVKNRVLEMPVWQGVSEDVEDLLTVHETGHALDTPCDGWLNALDQIAKKHHTQVTDQIRNSVKGFMNVIEDARIDKRQKRRYPGSRRNYLVGYKELIERGFFGPTSKDFNTYNFIDRLNIYFKGGFATIKFSPEEMPFVKRVENAETFDEVLALTDEIYGYCKSKGENEKKTFSDLSYEEVDEDEDGDDVEFDDIEGFEDDEEGDDSGRGMRGEGDIGEGEDGRKVSSQNDRREASDQSDLPSDGGDYVPQSETERAWQEKQQDLTSNNIEYVYATIPKPVISKIVDDYKVFLKENMNYYLRNYNAEYMAEVGKKFNQFKTEENNNISFMVKEFEMRKSADMYSKISISKTGVIDTNKLHSYKYNDDIFRRLAVMPKGKNHGFIMFIDWSGSMSPNFENTLRQLLSMVLFCKRVQIPFEVYNFRELNEYEGRNTYMVGQTSDSFDFKKGDLGIYAFKMRNILSSRMSLAELNQAFQILWAIGINTYNRVEPLAGTPLNGAIIAASELVNKFRRDNKLQIVNTIFLTDGGSNPIAGIVGDNMRMSWTHSYRKSKKYIIQDEVTKRDYYISSDFNGDDVTNTLLRSLKDRTGCNLIGFYLHSAGYRSGRFASLYGTYFGNPTNQKHYETMNKFWQENKFIPVTSYGYDEYYIINATSLRDDENVLKVDSNMSKTKIAKQFMSFSSKKSVNRVLLQRFINSVSAMAKAG